jgi:hypothetical protein
LGFFVADAGALADWPGRIGRARKLADIDNNKE